MHTSFIFIKEYIFKIFNFISLDHGVLSSNRHDNSYRSIHRGMGGTSGEGGGGRRWWGAINVTEG